MVKGLILPIPTPVSSTGQALTLPLKGRELKGKLHLCAHHQNETFEKRSFLSFRT